MESFTSDTSLSETIIVKRNAAGHIVVIHSDWHPDELVPFRFGLHRWGLVDPTRKCIVVIHPEEEMIIKEGFIAVGGDMLIDQL